MTPEPTHIDVGYLYWAPADGPITFEDERWIPLGSTDAGYNTYGWIEYGTPAWGEHFGGEYLEPLVLIQERPEDRPENQCPYCTGDPA